MAAYLDFIIVNDFIIKEDNGIRTIEIIFSDEHSLVGHQTLIGAAQTIAGIEEMKRFEACFLGIPLRLDRGATLLPEMIVFSMIDAIFTTRDKEGRIIETVKEYYSELAKRENLIPIKPKRPTIARLERFRQMKRLSEKTYRNGDFESKEIAALADGRFYASRKNQFDSSFEIAGHVRMGKNKTVIFSDAWLSIDIFCSGHIPEMKIPLEWITEIFPAADLFEVFKVTRI